MKNELYINLQTETSIRLELNETHIRIRPSLEIE